MKKLSTYGFTCRCEACTHKWPLLKELRDRRPKFLTRKLVILGRFEGILIRLDLFYRNFINFIFSKEIIEDIRKMNEVVFCKEARMSDTLANAIKFRKMLHGNVKSPSLMILLCEALILGIMKSYGNFYSEYSN